MVVDGLEFDYGLPGEQVWWWCVMGGAQELCRRMRGSLGHQEAVKFQKKVSKIGFDWSREASERDKDNSADDSRLWWYPQASVTYKDTSTAEPVEPVTTTYDAVFNSTTMGAQQHMQLESLTLNWGTKQAIRALGYGASCKVGIRFSQLWWMNPANDINPGVSAGGVAQTDESIRFCVYPSYNIDDDPKSAGVLLASYTWSQEAEKIGSLISRNSPEGEDELKELLFHDLARLHAKQVPGDPEATEKAYQKMYNLISSTYLDHYAFNWYQDPLSVGAFAFFGPGQFNNMWPWIIRNNGTYCMIGEAASSHHAWVVGALESAVRAVYQFLWVRSKKSLACSEAVKRYVQHPETLESLFCELPPEFDRTGDIKYATQQRSSPIGELLRHGIMAEVIRLSQGRDQLNLKDVTESQTAQFTVGLQTA